jgi:DNA-binding NarL/FixJ family response regulator
MKKTILVFSGIIIALLALFLIGQYTIQSGDLNIEIVIAIVAILFFFIGVYINKKSLHKHVKSSNEINHNKISELEISTREYEVLQEIASGLSNNEIADKLFLSESTIKTHVSNLLAKLNAKRRTQAIQIAKDLNIL